MTRRNINRIVLVLMLILMPLTYALNFIFGTDSLGFFSDIALFLPLITNISNKKVWRVPNTFAFFLWSVISILVGSIFYGGFPTYNFITTLFRIFLCFFTFSFVASCWAESKILITKTLCIVVIIEFIIGVFFILVGCDVMPAPDSIANYATGFFRRQAITLDNFSIPRMGGTFIESPPFGLFMLSSYVLIRSLGTSLVNKSKLMLLGKTASLLGSLLSLSDQIIFGICLILGGGYVIKAFKSKNIAMKIIFATTMLVIFVAVCGFISYRVGMKIDQYTGTAESGMSAIRGTSIGERAFHFSQVWYFLTSSYSGLLLFTGVGHGRYWDLLSSHSNLSDFFANGITTQFIFSEVLLGGGIIGLIILYKWLYNIYDKARVAFGSAMAFNYVFGLIIADSLQANWLWQMLFFTLGALFAAGQTAVFDNNQCLVKSNRSALDMKRLQVKKCPSPSASSTAVKLLDDGFYPPVLGLIVDVCVDQRNLVDDAQDFVRQSAAGHDELVCS